MRQRYTSVDPEHRPHTAKAILKWGVLDPLLGRRRTAPPGPPAPRVSPDLDLVHEDSGRARLTWIGHASFLGTLGGRSFLIDPVFSPRVGWAYRRYGRPGLCPEQLPAIDVVMVTHNHYDHLDRPSLRSLPPDVPAVVPEGMRRWFLRWNRRPVIELGWWERARLGELHITLVPARHWSRRGIWDTNCTLWGGFVVEGGGQAIYHAGDTGWFEGFSEIRRRFARLLAALLPVGGYTPAWFMEPNHLNPEQAGRAFLELQARHLIPMHWGAFQLTDEPLTEPAERVQSWWEREAPDGERRLQLLAVGETCVLTVA